MTLLVAFVGVGSAVAVTVAGEPVGVVVAPMLATMGDAGFYGSYLTVGLMQAEWQE